MKRKTVATIAIVTLLLVLMIWSFGSSAASKRENTPVQNPGAGEQSSAVFQDQDQAENEPDADLGKFGSRINREEYLRARDEYIARRRGIEPGRPFDPTLRGRAIEQMDRQEKGRRLESIVSGDLTPAAGGAWTPIGPLTLPNGVFIGSTPAPTSGRVTAIAIDPTNSQKVYLGTAQGGVWRSLDGGANWTSIFDTAQSLAIGALAVAPSSPSTLYVGTGEFNSCGDCFFGVGLYRIDNADTSATLVGPINPSQTIGNLAYNVFNGRSITKILVHPTDPATIWVSTARGVGGSGANALGQVPALATRGVYRSSNATGPATGSGAVTFQKLTVNLDNSPDTPPTGNADVVDMVMEPGTPDNILVAVIGLTSQNGGIYRSTNATTATPTFTQTKPVATGVRTSLAINKTGSVVTVYAATSETPVNTAGCTTAGSGAIYKSVNGGATWSDQLTGGGGFCAGQCFYDMPIAVDPNDANTVYIGGQTSSSCGRLVGKSSDGGDSFVSNSSGLHADDHALVFDGVGNIYTGNDGGVWKQSTCAATNSAWTNLNAGALNTLQFESIAVHPSDQFLMIGGTQDNGTEFQQTSSGNWKRAESGDGGYALIDQSASDTTNVTMYHTFFNDNTQMGFDRILKSACLPVFDSWPVRGVGFGANDSTPVPCDGGTTLVKSNGIVLTSTVLFYAPMALGPGTPNTVYFGADRLYRSSDRGDNMIAVSQAPLSGTSPISTIAIWKGDDNERMVGLQNGQVWATSTGSSTLVDISPSIPANPTGSATNKFIGRAMIDPNNKNVAYVTLSYYAPAGQGIWKITNLSTAVSPPTAVWSAAGSGIPSVPINAFAIDPANSNNLFAGTDIGVYFSSDAGATWTPFGTNLPRVAIFDLQIQPSNRILRAATHGRGIWETSITGAALTPPPTPPTITPPTNPIDTADIFVRQNYSDFLSRTPDFSGLSFWTNQITSCRCDQSCTDVARINTSGAFFLSIEFQQTGYLVERMYKTAFGDATQTSTLGGSSHQISAPVIRFSEFIPDVQQIGNGVIVNQGNWQQQLEDNKVAFSQSFVQRARFTTKYANSLSPSTFVDQLFQNAGVTPSATDRNAAINEFAGAADISNVAARARAFRDVAENATLQQQERNRAFVLMQYYGYLRRNPDDAPEASRDYTGYEFWLSKLNQFNGDFIAAEMVKAFINATEYRQRFGS